MLRPRLQRQQLQLEQIHSLNDLKQLLKYCRNKDVFILGYTKHIQINNTKDLTKLIEKFGNLSVKKVVDVKTAYLVSVA